MEPYIKLPPPLTYNKAIYWHDGAWHFEQMASRVMMKYERERDWALKRIHEELDHICKKKAGELGWHTYYEEDEERTDDLYVTIRRTIYECPGFREVKLWRVPHTVYTLSLRPQGGPIQDLPLRRLHYHEEHAWAALHEDTLHVALR